MADIQTEIEKLVEKIKNNPIQPMEGQVIPKRYKQDEVDCPMCGGLRWLRRDLPVGHPEFGKLIACDCSKYRLYSEISGLTQHECVNLKWSAVIDSGDAIKAKHAVQRALKRGYGWVYLHGDPGIAKTVILKTAVAELVREGKLASYTNMSTIIDHMREAYDTDNPSTESERRLHRWTDIDMLAIDEFDRIRQTPYASERQFRLMDMRYQLTLMQRSITIMASNVSPKLFDDYLRDRIEDGRFEVIDMQGESLRPHMTWSEDGDFPF